LVFDSRGEKAQFTFVVKMRAMKFPSGSCANVWFVPTIR
jgi:hypothetical protein